jgi:hypothetical protein
MKRYSAIAAALLLAATPALADSTRFGLDADVLHDSNASRGLYDADRKADNILAVEGSVTHSMVTGPRSGAVFRAGARYSQFTTFDDLSNLALAGRAAWRIQPGTEFSSLIFEVAGNLVWLQHADSAIRDGTIATLEASMGSHLTDRVRLGAGAGMDQRSGGDPGRPGEVAIYDMKNSRLWATLDYRIGNKSTAYGRIMYVGGDQVFNSVTSSGFSGAWATDPALAGELGGVVNSYRVDSSTFVYDLGLNLPLTGGHALDFQFSYYTSKAEEGSQTGNKYDGMLLRASYLYRFQ